MIADEINEVLARRLNLHLEDDAGTEKCWKEETDILSRDMKQTIQFITNGCSDEIFCWLGEVFQDVADCTQSRDFIVAIKERAKK